MPIFQCHNKHTHPHTHTQANATGRSGKSVREYLEKHYSPEAVKTKDDTVILAIKALLEVVQSGSKTMEVAVMEKGKPLEVRESSITSSGVFGGLFCYLYCKSYLDVFSSWTRTL